MQVGVRSGNCRADEESGNRCADKWGSHVTRAWIIGSVALTEGQTKDYIQNKTQFVNKCGLGVKMYVWKQSTQTGPGFNTPV